MELKSIINHDGFLRSKSFNRTFMELKYFKELGERNDSRSFNRTFMELK